MPNATLKVFDGIGWRIAKNIKRKSATGIWEPVSLKTLANDKGSNVWFDTILRKGGLFVDDFSDDPMTARSTFETKALQSEAGDFPYDSYQAMVESRPLWTYNNGGSGTSWTFSDRIRFGYASTHPQYRTTNVPTLSNFSGTINIEFSFYMTSSSNKDLTFAIDCVSQADYWSSANLDDGYFFQFDDSSSRWVRARRRDTSSATTLGTSSNYAFTQDAWNTCKITWNQSTGAIKVYIGGVEKLSVTDTTYDDFCPSGAGIRFMHSRYMSPSSAYSEIDYVKIWRSL